MKIPALARWPISGRALTRAAAVVLVAVLAATGWYIHSIRTRIDITAYFANTNGLYEGDDVLLLGLKIGRIDHIEPDGRQMKVSFHYDSSVAIPADAKAVVLSPTLVSSRAIQLTPAHTGGPQLADGDTIDISRTAVPVEWDDFRKQLERLAQSLGPTGEQPTGPLGSFINSAAGALKGNGDRLNTTITTLSDAMSTIAGSRNDLFSTIRNLQVFVSALAASDQQIVEINGHLASVSQVLVDSDSQLSTALSDLDTVAADIQRFVADNRNRLQHSVDQLASVTTMLNNNRATIEQTLHVAPHAFANLYNIYQPAQGALTGALTVPNMQNPVQFICGAIQAASQLGAAEAAKLCVQYLGPVLKSIGFNYPPVGANPMTGVQARRDQVDYSEPFLNPYPAGATVDAGSGMPGLFGRTGQR
ncbi:MCE family protein [Nocardia jinanensis]|uniref:Mammalian cell entry protein n=1 Tax=Nocardia jinanensis TaxID=382504 RepID=A0A917VTJ4_9NOCA|nr:MCE family protein [Nocardia jinanensis]GGL13170.1 mammalian cell entry protein [Nocardia jinanensis]